MSYKYILVGQTPVPCDDLLEWARWMEENHLNRHVWETTIGEHWISTVFLGLDHQFLRHLRPTAPPILFETMIFCHHTPVCELDNEMCRYSEWLEAEAGHQEMVAKVTLLTVKHGPER